MEKLLDEDIVASVHNLWLEVVGPVDDPRCSLPVHLILHDSGSQLDCRLVEWCVGCHSGIKLGKIRCGIGYEKAALRGKTLENSFLECYNSIFVSCAYKFHIFMIYQLLCFYYTFS